MNEPTPRFDHLVLRLLSKTFAGTFPSLPLAETLAIGNFWQADAAALEFWAFAFWLKLIWDMPPLAIENKSAVIKNKVIALFMRQFVAFALRSEIGFK